MDWRTCVLGRVYARVDTAVANRQARVSRMLRGAASNYAGGLRSFVPSQPATRRITTSAGLGTRRPAMSPTYRRTTWAGQDVEERQAAS
ncbi:hypothetical protein [Streptomyces sp. NPDC021012]|uniref:hypothetical protein n=1 Tax=unclassified Streptomyces TaxID=2593676 RepID=UPI0037AB35A0